MKSHKIFVVAAVVLWAVLITGYFYFFGDKSKISVDRSCVKEEERTIRGDSMSLTLKDGQKANTLNGYFNCNPVKPGQVVVLEFATRQNESFIKRVAAVGGDTLVFEEENAKINGEVAETNAGNEYKFAGSSKTILSLQLQEGKIPEGYYLILSDEIGPTAFDSRQFGFVEQENLKGLVVVKEK